MKANVICPHILVVLATSLVFPTPTFCFHHAANAGEKSFVSPRDAALQHLVSVMDQYHLAFDVYTDISAAGNHFTVFGKISSAGDEASVSLDVAHTSWPFSGSSCIRCSFFPGTGRRQWGGYYFLNGVMRGADEMPRPNWGEYPNAGIDLRGATRLTFWARGENGGEMVEFFAFGVGRDSITGYPTAPFCDSARKVSRLFRLKKDWTFYYLDLRQRDLSYVIGGFGWSSNVALSRRRSLTFYLDEIKFNKPRPNEPRFLVSYETIPSTEEFDRVMKNVAFTYDNALTILAYLAHGTDTALQRAQLIADAFTYAINNDLAFEDGRLRNAYQGGDLTYPPGWVPRGKSRAVRLPGCWNFQGAVWEEDPSFLGTHTGSAAWAIIALLAMHQATLDPKYLTAAETLGQWIETNTRDERGCGGYTGGYEGKQPPQTKLLWKSTEHNIGVFVAFKRLQEVTHDVSWQERAQHARKFVESMWDDSEGHFWIGTTDDGETINKSAIPLDVNTLGLLALGDIAKYARGIQWAEENCFVEADGFKGFDFDTDRDHVWFEGTAQMVLAYRMLGHHNKVALYLDELRKAQAQAPHTNGLGLVAASADKLSTGLGWFYYNRLHVGATAWFVLAESGLNPFWWTVASDMGR
ncbi:MAG: hypothetical protein N2Z21_10995 [Candidatus Sumerlaeaceae bacterium]|nr:hypothetical protein [Candidatus Sumerlaeaceae bacterium]